MMKFTAVKNYQHMNKKASLEAGKSQNQDELWCQLPDFSFDDTDFVAQKETKTTQFIDSTSQSAG